MNCKYCEKEFDPSIFKKKNPQFCSRGCIGKFARKNELSGKKKSGEDRNCKLCSKEFYVQPHRLKTNFYCSFKCAGAARKSVPIKYTCHECKKEGTKVPSRFGKERLRFCSNKCKFKYREKHSKDILEKRLLFAKARYKRLGGGAKSGPNYYRNKALNYYPNKCEICDYSEYAFCLDVHHVDSNVKNDLIENLQVLCCMCHRKITAGVIENPRLQNKILKLVTSA